MALAKTRSASFDRTLMTVSAVAAVALMVASEHCVARSYVWDPTLLCPVATDDSVIVAYGHHSGDAIAAYDNKTGLLLWQKYWANPTQEPWPDTSFVGEMKVCGHLLYAPTRGDGVYVLDVRDGQLIQRLQSEGSVIACVPGYMFVTDPNNRTDAVVAIDTADFEVVWRRRFPWPFRICEITPSGPRLELLLGEFDAQAPQSRYPWSNYVQVKLRTEDGRILSRIPTARPAHYDMIPSTLPRATRRWLTKLLQRGDVFIPRTEILELGHLLFVGNLRDSTAPPLHNLKPEGMYLPYCLSAQRQIPQRHRFIW